MTTYAPWGIIILLIGSGIGLYSCKDSQLNAAKEQLGSTQTALEKCLADVDAQNASIRALQVENESIQARAEERVTQAIQGAKKATPVSELSQVNQEWGGM